MIVDVTVGVVTQLVFVLLGLVLLLIRSSEPIVLTITWSVLAGLGIFVVVITIFVLLQHKGLFGLSTLIAGAVLRNARLTEVSVRASRIDDAVRAIYRNRRTLRHACLWRFVGWVAGTGEIWLTMYFFDHPIGLDDAIILESLSSGIRAAAFMVPGALGLLEGGFVVLGVALGIPATTALVVALAKRVRELGLGLPGLVAWHLTEAKGLFVKRDAR
jgi:putative membrane protein